MTTATVKLEGGEWVILNEGDCKPLFETTGNGTHHRATAWHPHLESVGGSDVVVVAERYHPFLGPQVPVPAGSDMTVEVGGYGVRVNHRKDDC